MINIKKITQHLILIGVLTLLSACGEVSNTEQAPANKVDSKKLNLSLPEETISNQEAPITNEQPLLPELFDQEINSSKAQLDGQVLLKEKAPIGAEAVDGAKISITVNQ